jgi:hypothetical protein
MAGLDVKRVCPTERIAARRRVQAEAQDHEKMQMMIYLTRMMTGSVAAPSLHHWSVLSPISS